MKNVNKYILIVLTLLSSISFGQVSSEKLRKEQEILERRLENTKLLLEKTKGEKEASLSQLQIINNQVQFREELVRNFDRQVRGADLTMRQKRDQIRELNEKIDRLKKQYKKLVIYSYKHRSKYNKLMFIFSSDSYYEALKRNKYLSKIAELQKKQFLIIQQHQGLIKREINDVQLEKENKMIVLQEKQKERAAIIEDKKKQEIIYTKFKTAEATLLSEMQADQKKKEAISRQIDAAIKREIAAAEAKRKKEAEALAAKKAKEEEARRKAEAIARANNPNKAVEPKVEPKGETILPETSESELVGRSFETNRGKLPWPVLKGTVTENYGKNPHPSFENVFTNNNGIDISAVKNAPIRAVFEGEVTSVLNIPGAGKVVILKHGNYRTVYSNLQSTNVSVGDKVDTKEIIGSLLVKDGKSLSVLHFEIHQVFGGNVQSMNPILWISR